MVVWKTILNSTSDLINSNLYIHPMNKYRILKKGDLYMPQIKFLWWWKNMKCLWLDSMRMCKIYIEEDITERKSKKLKSVVVWES